MNAYMSRPARKPTLWTLRHVSTQTSLRPSKKAIGIEEGFLKEKTHRKRKVSVQVSLRVILRLIRVDTLRRVHNVGLQTGHLIYTNNTCTYEPFCGKLTFLNKEGSNYVFHLLISI